MSDLEINPTRSFKVKSNGAIRFPICEFPLVFNGNILLNSARLRDMSLQILCAVGFDLSCHLRSNRMAKL